MLMHSCPHLLCVYVAGIEYRIEVYITLLTVLRHLKVRVKTWHCEMFLEQCKVSVVENKKNWIKKYVYD